MKIIAHRGASMIKAENSVEGLSYGADLGADAVECDVTQLKDGKFVIFHDESLLRFTGKNIAVKDITYPEMKSELEACGKHLLTFEELLAGYDRKTPILLHVKMEELDESFLEIIKNTSVPIIFGLVSLSAVRALHSFIPPERILAFMPRKRDYIDFFNAGAGKIRLWENWLSDVTPEDVKNACEGAEVWVMARDEVTENRGNEKSLNKCVDLGADGILLDDITMALAWRATAV